MNATLLKQAIKDTNGRFMSVTWQKKDGTLTKRLLRVGVTKGLVGGVSGVAHIEKYLPMFDVSKRKYISVNCETIVEIKCGNVLKYSVNN